MINQLIIVLTVISFISVLFILAYILKGQSASKEAKLFNEAALKEYEEQRTRARLTKSKPPTPPNVLKTMGW